MKTNSLSTKAVKDCFRNKAHAYFGDSIVVSENFNHANSLIRIVDLFKSIVASKEPIFSIKERPSGRKFFNFENPCFLGIKPYLPIDIRATDNGPLKSLLGEEIRRSFPAHKLNPCAEVFIETVNVKLVGVIDPDFNRLNNSEVELVKTLGILNAFGDSLRSKADSPEFKTSLKNYERLIRKNDTVLTDFINDLIVQHPNLHVLKMNFSYQKDEHPPEMSEIGDQYVQAKNDRENFLSGMRVNKLFEHMLGCAWMTQYASEVGFHNDLLLFFDGSMIQEAINLPKLIGEYWAIITKGKGQYFNFKASGNDCNAIEIDVINRDDRQSTEALKNLASQLIKSDYFARFIGFGQREKTFGILKKSKTRNRRTSVSGH